jgi:hypothetical protein
LLLPGYSAAAKTPTSDFALTRSGGWGNVLRFTGGFPPAPGARDERRRTRTPADHFAFGGTALPIVRCHCGYSLGGETRLNRRHTFR